MKNRQLIQWCESATKLIRYGPDRKAVCAELLAHLEDHRDALVAQGLSWEDAASAALKEMGSATEIAEDLAKVHTPWLGRLLSTVRVISILLIVCILFTLLEPGLNVLTSLIGTRHTCVGNDHCVDQVHCAEDFHSHPHIVTTSDGYRMEITEVTRSCLSSDLLVKLKVTYWPWMDYFTIATQFWAIDSNGNFYPSRAEAGYGDMPKVTTSGGSFSACHAIQAIKIQNFDKSAQWVELHYDWDGRNIVLRIDLTGGEQP